MTETVAAALARARAALAHLDDPRLEAGLLLTHLLDWPDSKLFSHADEAIDAEQLARFEALVQRRAGGEPSAYLTGSRAFWTLELAVTPDTLVPRPDTEALVEQCLRLLHGRPAPRVLDLGTGSGALALAIASERPDAQVEASDCSAAALAVARDNARRHGITIQAWHLGSWFAALPHEAPRYELIVSNPPYIADGDPHLQALRHEPIGALTSGADGLDAIRELVREAPAHLAPGGQLALEHGHDQSEAVAALFERHGYRQLDQQRDLGRIIRASAATRPESEHEQP